MTTSETLQLSVAHAQLQDLPKEDLADALEELSGEAQTALFSALETDKAAETLTETEPRAQRQIMANLRKERAMTILASLSTPQLVDLLTVLPHEDQLELLELLPEPRQTKVRNLLSDREATASDFMDSDYLTIAPTATVAEAKALIRASGLEAHAISYLFVMTEGSPILGVVDARQILVAADDSSMEAEMTSPVVSAEVDDVREDLTAVFTKYHFRMIPVVDAEDRIQGVVHYNDIMKSSPKN